MLNLVVDRIPEGSNCSLFLDRFFTLPSLVEKLLEYGCFATGTVQANRISNPPLKASKEMKQRGEMDECVSSDGTLSLVKWSDNNIVHILSSAYNAGGGHEVLQWDKDFKSKKYVNCPSSIIYYNKSMG